MKISRFLTALFIAVGLVGVTATSAQAVLNTNASVPVDGGSSIVYSPSGDRVYSSSFGGKTVSSIDAATQTLIATSSAMANAAKDIAVSPDGSKLYVLLNNSTSTANRVVVMDASTLTALSTITVGPNARQIAITPDGRTLFVTNYLVANNVNNNDNSVSVIDLTATTPTVTYLASSGGGAYAFNNPQRVVVSSDGLYLFVENVGSSNIMKIRISDYTVVWTTGAGTVVEPSGMALSPDGTTLYVGSRDTSSTNSNFIDCIDTSTGSRFANGRISTPSGTAPSGSSNGLYDMSVSGNGTMLYVVGASTAGFLEYSIGVNHLPTFSHTYAMANAMRVEASPVDSTFFGGISGTVYPYGPKIGRSTQEFTKATGESLTSLGFSPTGLTGTVTYSISAGLPAGLTFDPATGIISGTPTATLTRTLFTISASDGTSTAAGNVYLTVTASNNSNSGNTGSSGSGSSAPGSSGGNLALTGLGNSTLFGFAGTSGFILIALGGVMVAARKFAKK